MKIKRLLITVFASFAMISGGTMITACSSTNMTPEKASQMGYVQIPNKATSFSHKDYRDVYTQFKTAGFTNIRIVMMEDLVTGWLTDKDSVDHVSVNGKEAFKKDYVSPDSPVIIYVHSFKGAKPDIDGYKDPANTDGSITLGYTVNDFEDKDKFDVCDTLTAKGFTNVTFTPLQDLITGFLHSDGSVKEVSINGSTNYTKTDTFLPDVLINISYHCYEGDYCTNGLEHTYVIDALVEATCTESGLSEGKHCSVCNKVFTEQKTIPAKGHTVAIDEMVEATCSHPGLTEGKHCSVCGEVLIAQESIPSNPDAHVKVVDKEAQPATCIETGLTEEAHCSECNKQLSVQTIEPINPENHASLTVVSGHKATCVATGISDGQECRACGATVIEQAETPIDPTNHANVVIDPAVPATKTSNGKTEGKHCSSCGTVIVAQKTTTWVSTTSYMTSNIASQSEINTYVNNYKDDTVSFNGCIYYATFASGSTSMLEILITGGNYVKNTENSTPFKVTVSKYDKSIRNAIPVAEGDNVTISLTIKSAGNNIVICDLVSLVKR